MDLEWTSCSCTFLIVGKTIFGGIIAQYYTTNKLFDPLVCDCQSWCQRKWKGHSHTSLPVHKLVSNWHPRYLPTKNVMITNKGEIQFEILIYMTSSS